jgi:hypothetical protein
MLQPGAAAAGTSLCGRGDVRKVIAAYLFLLLLLAPLRPLWLDELIELSDTYRLSLADTIGRVAHNPGGVPLVYLAENLIVNHLGHAFYTAHLFSILCAVVGLASFIWLDGLLEVPSGWLTAALIYAVLPVSLRYAVEARQYGPALALSILATTLLFRPPSWPNAALYGLVLAGGMYAQPYVAFVAIAHLLWSWRQVSFKFALAGVALAAALFLPWYLYARGYWVHAVSEAGYQSTLNWKTPLMILRELSGGGYLLTLALVALAICGYWYTSMAQSAKRLLLLWSIVPIPLVLAANALFHYFFAIRQLLFIVPPLCILAADGLAALQKGWRPCVAAGLLLAACVYDVRWFTNAKEDWSLSATAAQNLVRPGSCALVIPDHAADLYRLYQPDLPVCSGPSSGAPSIVLVSPYATAAERESAPGAPTFGPTFNLGGTEVRTSIP